MKSRLPLISALVLLASAAVFVSPARAATVTIIGTDYSGSNICKTITPTAYCFVYEGKATASISGNVVSAINPITAYVDDTIAITNQAGTHNIVFCKTGTTVNGWNCGDPIDPGGTDPSCCQDSSGPGAPSKIGWGASAFSTALNSPGTYFFWCGIGNHRLLGQYGKLEVLSERPTTTTTTSTTSTTVASTTSVVTQTTSVSATVAAPTLTVKKSGGRVTASGRATAGARVSLQKLVGKKWVTVASTKASASGSYTIRAKAESKKTTYRVTVGSRSSTSRPI